MKPTLKVKIVNENGDLIIDESNWKILNGGAIMQSDGNHLEIRDIGNAEIELKIKQKKKPTKSDFDRLFDLPRFNPDSQLLIELGASNGQMFDPNLDINDNPTKSKSWVTYFGQFVDHDVTLDRTPFVDAPIDISELTNFREPLLNLDSVYGGGLTGNSELYDSSGKFILSQK